jgi:hypothetical protein
MVRKPKETPHLRLRVETALLVRLEKAAEKNGRTLTGEITHRLNESFKGDDLMAAMDALSEKMTVKLGDMIRKQGRWVRDGDEQ